MSGERRFFRRDRLTAYLAIGVVGALSAAAVVFGVGLASAKYHLADVGGWLTSTEKGQLVHVNGLSGKVDGKVSLSGTAGHPMKVIQQGGVVLIVDEVTGVVSRVDPAHLNVVQGATYRGAAGMQVVSSSGVAYALDQQRGSVQRLDPMTLATLGNPISLTGPLGSSAIDAESTLWVPVPTNGQAASVRAGRPGQPIGVGRAGDDLALTIAAGSAVISDFTSGQSVVLGEDGAQVKVKLPSSVVRAPKGSVLVPDSTEGQLVPYLVGGSLVVLNSGNGTLSTVTLQLPRHRLGAPQALGQRVYIPDQSTGSVQVYDAATNRMSQQVPVTGQPGPLDAFVKDGLLWVNGPDSSRAVVVDGTGVHHAIHKYTPDVPGSPKGPSNPSPTIGAGRVSTTPGPGHHGGGTGNHGQAPAPAPAPPPPPRTPTRHRQQPPQVTPPAKPINLRATPQPDGTIKVDFQPGGGGAASGFTLLAPPGLTTSPSRIAPGGPNYTFIVQGGSCGTEYQFAVAAQYSNGGQPGEVDSDFTDPTLSCTQPDAPSGITGTGTAQGARVGWQAPPNAAAKNVSYNLQVTGPKTFTKTNFTGTSVVIPSIWKNGTYTIKVTASNQAGGKAGVATTALKGPAATYSLHNGGLPSEVSLIWAQANPNSATVEQITNANSQKVQVTCQVMGAHYQHPSGKAALAGNLYDYVNHNGHVGYMIGYLPATPHNPWQQFAGPTIWEC